MTLGRAIEHGKEKRKPYRGSKAIARSCRHGGWCERCRGDRLKWRERDRENERADRNEA